MDDFAVYDRDIASGIINSNHDFIIVTKTRDEVELIEDWITHHLEVVGPKGMLLIFDNGSIEKRMWDVYTKYAGARVRIFHYKNYHLDALHKVARNPGLYAEIARFGKYFTFLDTDEFLYYYDSNSNRVIKSIDFDGFLGKASWAPSMWFENVGNLSNAFKLGDVEYFKQCYHWGKPVFNAKKFHVSTDMPIIHNTQYYEQLKDNDFVSGFICFHMKNLWPRRRLRVDFWKLQANSGLDKQIALDEFLNDIDSYDIDSQYFREIRLLIRDNLDTSPVSVKNGVPCGSAVLIDDKLNFNDQYSEIEFRNHIVTLGFLRGVF